MLNFGRPLASLTREQWMVTIEALRYAAHQEPDDGHWGWGEEESKAAHAVADELVKQFEIEHDCPACEVEKDMASEEHGGHTEPEANCVLCREVAQCEQPAPADPDQAALDAYADTQVEKAETESEAAENCGHYARATPHGCAVCIGEDEPS